MTINNPPHKCTSCGVEEHCIEDDDTILREEDGSIRRCLFSTSFSLCNVCLRSKIKTGEKLVWNPEKCPDGRDR